MIYLINLIKYIREGLSLKQVSTPETWGDKNKKLIVELLKSEGALSRAEISRRTSMSFPAVSSNVQFLLDHGYIKESGTGNNTLGRKAMLLSFNAEKGVVIGLDLGRSSTSLILSNLLGEALYKVSKDVDIHHGRLNIIDHLDNLIANALVKNDISKKDLLCIGIGIPGVIDNETGSIMLAPFAENWSNYNLVEGLQARYSCPIRFENSVNLGALGEKWKGVGVPYSNIFCINYSIGIGSALILNNELFTGSNGIAGEIGYSIPTPSHIRQTYAEEGALEELISGRALDERVKSMQIGCNSLKELFESNHGEHDAIKQEIIEEIKNLFFVILLASVSIINPDVVILSGRIGINIGRLLLSDWEKALAAHVKYPPKLVISESGSLANVYGAVRFALAHVEDDLCAS